MKDLKPCPFCGGKVKINHNGNFEPDGIWCNTCHIMVRYPRIKLGKKESYGEFNDRMAEEWNRRAKS